MNNIFYLVFSGGGAAGAAYGGALQELENQSDFSMKQIKAVAGASAGAITALLVALTYSAAEITQKLRTINFSEMEDGGFLICETQRMFSKYGKYKGQALLKLIHELIIAKFPGRDPAKITFNDIKALSGIDLHIVTTKNYLINRKYKNKSKIFSTEKHGNTPIANIIKTSASAPLYFERCRLRKIEKGRYELGTAQDHLYSDGGVILNYPIEIFDQPKYLLFPESGDRIVNPHVLGFALLNREDITHITKFAVKEVIPDSHPIEYFSGLISSSLFNSTLNVLRKRSNIQRTVQIDRKNVSLAEFNLSEEKKEKLIQSGAKGVREFLLRRNLLNENPVNEAIIEAEIIAQQEPDEAIKQSCFAAFKFW